MFQLTDSELDCAKAAIEHHGYSTLLPPPPEWDDLVDHWCVLREYLCSLNLDKYTPKEPLAIAVAKDEASIRIVHLLHPEDMVLYTALTLLVKDDIEGARLPRAKGRVYSYRASKTGTTLYASVRDKHREYMGQLRRKVARLRTKAVAVTDIADFYASISHAELLPLLSAAGRTRRVKKAAELLVSVFAAGIMTRCGHGIPTGPVASRLIAEVLLNDVDGFLESRRIDFVRWVDDYNFFAPSLASAKAILFDLAAWLYNKGLILQAAKTHVLDQDTYAKGFLVDFAEKFSEREAILTELLQAGYSGADDVEDDLDELMDDLLAVDLLETLVDAISNGEYVDYRVIGFVVRRLRNMPLDRRVGNEVLEVLVENIERLSPIIAAVAPLIIRLLSNRKMSKRIGKRLLRAARYARVDHHALWILTIFSQRGRRAFLDDLLDIYQRAESHVIRRYAVLAIAGSGGRVRYELQEWEEAPPLVRLALLKAGDLGSENSLTPKGKLEELVRVGAWHGRG